LLKARQKFQEFKNAEIGKIEKEKEVWKENLKIVESLNCKETDILDLDIGGTHKFTTTRSTLIKVKCILHSFLIRLLQQCFQGNMNYLNIMEEFLLIEMELHLLE
jgi:hypothetical protein